MLQMLNILEATTSRRWARQSADYWHLFVEAKKLAYADRARFYADPDFAKVPVERADLEAVRRRAPQADRPEQGADRRSRRATRSSARATPSTCASSTRTATASRSSRATTTASAPASSPADSASRMQNRGSLFALDEQPPQPPGAAQAAVPHDHPGAGDEGRQAVVRASASWAATCSRRATCRCSST